MLRGIRMGIAVIGIFILVSIIVFILLVRFYPPLDRFLFQPREFEISPNDIQFWVKRVPSRNYYRVDAKYLKSPEELSGGVYFTLEDKEWEGGWSIVFNPEDNKIYGGGWWERSIYCLGGGKIEGEIFKPIFPEGTKFTFCLPDRIGISSAPAYYITIHLPSTLKKLTKDELERPSLAEIVEEETKIRE